MYKRQHRDSPGEDGIHYKGQGTVINYDGIIVEPLETSTPQRSSLLTDVNGFPTFYRSSVEINEAKSMKLRNSKLVDNNKDITIDVTDTDSSLAYGYSLSELEAEVDLLNIGLGKRLYWEGGTLKGDVTWFRGAPGTLTNNGDNVIETEIAQHGGDSFLSLIHI